MVEQSHQYTPVSIFFGDVYLSILQCTPCPFSSMSLPSSHKTQKIFFRISRKCIFTLWLYHLKDQPHILFETQPLHQCILNTPQVSLGCWHVYVRLTFLSIVPLIPTAANFQKLLLFKLPRV